MFKVHVSRRQHQGRRFEVDVDPVETVLGNDAGYGGNKLRNGVWGVQLEILSPATQSPHHLFPLTFQVGDVSLQLV